MEGRLDHEILGVVPPEDESPDVVAGSIDEARTHTSRAVESVHGDFQYDGFVPRNCFAMKEALHLMNRAAQGDSSVIILGETGTGKEVAARSIHKNSARNKNPFVAVNCGAIPSGLIESEFFGHAKGAFTGAYFKKSGVFESADGGTVFLDEIADLPLDMQVKLLRVLNRDTFFRVGDTSKPIRFHGRILCATNQNLEGLMRAERFRPDLFYRLDVLSITLPPLRHYTAEDIVLLCDHILEKLARTYKKAKPSLAEDAKKAIASQRWDGNIRELENALETAFVMSEGADITFENLPRRVRESFLEIDCSSGAANAARELESLHRRLGKGVPMDDFVLGILKTLEQRNGNGKKKKKKGGTDAT